MSAQDYTSGVNKKALSLQEQINNCVDSNGAHILYMFNEYDKYINNAIHYIAEGIDKDDKIILVESQEFIDAVKEKLLLKGYSNNQLKSISHICNSDYYLSDREFNAENCFQNLVKTLKPNIDKKLMTRIWGQVLVKNSLVYELRMYECECDKFMGGESVLSVCSYNSLTTPSVIQNEMLKVHKYLMIDDQIEKSPFYNQNHLLTISDSERDRLLKIERENKLLKKKNQRLLVDKARQKEREKHLKLAKLNAEKANYMKNIFLSQMSHDLRTPLNTIQGYSQIMLLDNNKKNYQYNVQKILYASKHLLQLIEEILDFSAMESGKISINLENIHLKTFINNCVSSIFNTNNSDITVEIENIDDNIFIEADPLRLNQVITNLVNNAIAYNKPSGKVCIYVEYDQNNEEIKLYFKDTGIGIQSDELELIFEPFYRSKTCMSKWKGTGLGLAIVAQLTKQMNGKYGVISEVDIGTTFWVSLKGWIE
ncbi:ATP-binding protein [Halalkalibacter kiskunsagensis]|uniref:histidine kinase n=1 Tax=Halalkalibacter kiskunsagensis TaxID=1548599 RepID=A0ABV6K6R4_9BACI